MPKKNTRYLIDAIAAAICAGAAIMEVYDSDFLVETKEDQSPLTQADKRAHKIIKAALEPHGIPFISEEGSKLAYEDRANWGTLWIVDPLDGTKEFVKRNGEFTVNIALIENSIPVMGVVYAPVNQWLYFAARDIGAHKVKNLKPEYIDFDESRSAEDHLNALIQKGTKLPINDSNREVYTIVGSRSHGSSELTAFVDKKKQTHGTVDFIPAGSSLKICLVAEGTADIYPRLGPTMEWDTAAGHAVAECAGAKVYIYGSRDGLRYNRRDMLNPWFIVER